MTTPVRVVIVGMGQRAIIYGKESLSHPELFQIVGVVDVNPDRIRLAQETFGLPPERCFSSVEAFLAAPRFADAIINGTMDPQHVPTTLPLLSAGYDVLLEKPFATNQHEADALLSCARKNRRKVMICHVLRYSPFYRRIREILASGEIGRVMHIDMLEQVSFFHESVSFVRGKYASPRLCGSGMILSKCSHDLDLMAWMMHGNTPASVASTGSLFQFRPEAAPTGAGTHCLINCAVERECPYSCARLYIEHPQRWTQNIWFGHETPDDGEKRRLLSDPQNPYSRCVYHCGLEIVDHQSLLIAFSDGATGTFSVNGGASGSGRHIHITGTRGEIDGVFEAERFTVSLIAPEAPGGRTQRTVDVSTAQHGNAHGGGDQAIVRDFIALVTGQTPSPSSTTLEDSVVGHRLAFLAEDSRAQGGAMLKF